MRFEAERGHHVEGVMSKLGDYRCDHHHRVTPVIVDATIGF